MTKYEIQQTAIKMFRENGYSNVTIVDICDKLGITKPTFYNYVKSKEELILDFYDETIKGILSDPFPFLLAESAAEKLIIVFSKLIKDTLSYGFDFFSNMMIANLKENHHSFELRNNLTDFCLIIIQQAQNNNEIKNISEPKAIYYALAHCFAGYELNWCIEKNDELFCDFFKSFNAICIIDEKFEDTYKKYI